MVKPRGLSPLLLALALITTLATCSSGPRDPASVVIRGGKTVTVDLGDGARLIIPPGGMTEGATVRATYRNPPQGSAPGLKLVGAPVKLISDPPDAIHGLLTLEFPITAGSRTDGTNVSDFGIATFDEQSGKWMPVDSTIDFARNYVVAQIAHFSSWNPFTWDWAKIGARINQRVGEIVSKRAPAARCSRGMPVPGWVSGLAGITNDPAIAIRACAEGENEVFVVELVNNRPYSMYLTYGSAVKWGWHEEGDSGQERIRNQLGDRLAGPNRLYLPPRGRASVGILPVSGYIPFSIGFGFRSLAIDVLDQAMGEAIVRIPESGECMNALFNKPFGNFSAGKVKDAAVDLLGCVATDAAALGFYDSSTIEQLETFSKRLTLVGLVLRWGEIEWKLLDLFVDGAINADSGLGAGFSLVGRSPPAPATPPSTPSKSSNPPPGSQPTPNPTPPPVTREPPSTNLTGASLIGDRTIRGTFTVSSSEPVTRCVLVIAGVGESAGGCSQIDVGGLAYSTTYSIYAYAESSAGRGANSNTGSVRTNDPPPPPPPAISLARGGSAPSGYWYSVTLSHFPPNSSVSLTCRDSVDPGGFYTETEQIDANGNGGDSTLCYSADHPDHWVTGGGYESNHVTW